MERAEVKKVVAVTLALLRRIAQRTRTAADDLLAAILQANEERLVDAVMELLKESAAPTEEQVTRALLQVGIKA